MYEKEIQEIERIYRDWLDFSKLDKKDLLKYRPGEFKINSKFDSGFGVGVIEIGYIDKDNFKKIGSPILYEFDDEVMKTNLALLILYIAERLDEENKNAPAFLKREERYFYKKAKLSIEKISLI